jgi:hypothetical protein
MKRLAILTMILIVFMTGCNSGFQPQLTRVDVQKLTKDGNKVGEERIASKDELQTLEQAFQKIKLSPKTKPEMTRKEDVLAIFFIQEEKNMPESLYEYRVWFDGETATIISSKENEGYGRLTDKTEVRDLKSALLPG